MVEGVGEWLGGWLGWAKVMKTFSILRVFFRSGTGGMRTTAAGFSHVVEDVKGVPSVPPNAGRGSGDGGLGKSVGVAGEIFGSLEHKMVRRSSEVREAQQQSKLYVK